MNTLWKAVSFAGALALAPAAFACEPAATAAEPAVEAAPAPAIEVTATGDQVVKVNSGNEAVDAVANLTVKCTERSAAFKTCDAMGGFKAMGCRKLAEHRYKDLQCPL
jgi:4-aminobutyrate aminotransferase-like enzyme